MISYLDAYKDQFWGLGPSAESLNKQIVDSLLHAENFSVYGIRKMWHAMNREGFHIGRDKTAQLMKIAGESGRRRGRTPVTTSSPKVPDHRPDLVQRDFRAQAPGRLWVADITYVRTLSGFAYTAFVVDVYSRKIVGVATRSTMRTDALPKAGFGACVNDCRANPWKPTDSPQRSGQPVRVTEVFHRASGIRNPPEYRNSRRFL